MITTLLICRAQREECIDYLFVWSDLKIEGDPKLSKIQNQSKIQTKNYKIIILYLFYFIFKLGHVIKRPTRARFSSQMTEFFF